MSIRIARSVSQIAAVIVPWHWREQRDNHGISTILLQPVYVSTTLLVFLNLSISCLSSRRPQHRRFFPGHIQQCFEASCHSHVPSLVRKITASPRLHFTSTSCDIKYVCFYVSKEVTNELFKYTINCFKADLKSYNVLNWKVFALHPGAILLWTVVACTWDYKSEN